MEGLNATQKLRQILRFQPYVDYLNPPLGLVSNEMMKIARKELREYTEAQLHGVVSRLNIPEDDVYRLSGSVGGALYTKRQVRSYTSFINNYGGSRIYSYSNPIGRIIWEMDDISDRKGEKVMNSARVLLKLKEKGFIRRTDSSIKNSIERLVMNNLVARIGTDIILTTLGESVVSDDTKRRWEKLKEQVLNYERNPITGEIEKLRIDLFK